MILVFL
jgi:cAMP-dependent protein kinase regulator